MAESQSLGQPPLQAYGLACLAVLWSLVVLLGMRLAVGWSLQSLALLASSLHGGLAAVSGILSILGLRSEGMRTGRAIAVGPLEAGITFGLWAVIGCASASLLGWSGQRILGLPLLARPPVAQAVLLLVLLLAIVAFILAGVTYGVAKQFERANLASLKVQADLILQDSLGLAVVWLGLQAMARGYRWVDEGLVVVLLLWMVIKTWRMLVMQLPWVFQQQAIAPEALVATVQQVEGVLDCVPLRSRGVVGRQVLVELQLLLHPEFQCSAARLVGRIEVLLRRQYGEVQLRIYLAERDASGRVRITQSL